MSTMKLNTDNLHIINKSKRNNAAHLLNLNNSIDKLKDNNQNNINTHRPAQALSFGGSIASKGSWFIKSGFINGLTEFVNKNEAAYNAIYSLIVAGMLKPFFVLRTKGAEEKDKQIIATKNFLQAFIGSFMTYTVGGTVIKKSTDTLKNNLKMIKYDNDAKKFIALEATDNKILEIAKETLIKENDGLISRFSRAKKAHSEGKSFFSAFKKQKKAFIPSKEAVLEKANLLKENLETKHLKILNKNSNFVQELLKSAKDTSKNSTLLDAFESVWKNSTGTFTAVAKAVVSSALLPGVMAFIFAKRNLEKQREEAEKSGALLNNNSLFNSEKQKFIGMLDKQNLQTKEDKIGFCGNVAAKASEKLTQGVEYIAMSKPGECFVKWIHNLPGALNKPSARMGDIESFGLTAYWLINTSLSKKIEPSQKLGLNVHTALVTCVASICSFLIDTLLDPLVNKAANSYADTIENIAKQAKKMKSKEAVAFINENCKKLLNSKEIIEKLSSNLKDEKAIKEAAKELSNGYSKKLSKLKSLTIFTLVVRFLVPVLMVKPSNKLKQKIVEHRKQKEEMKAKKENN